MPLSTSRDDQRRRLVVMFTDPWSVEEVAVVLDRQRVDRTWTYGMMCDMRETTRIPAEPDVRWLVKRSQDQMALHGTRGPVALLVHSGEQERLVRTYAAAAQAYVRVQVFDHADAADAWLTQALE